MTSTKYFTSTLPNGLRIIQWPAEAPVVYCGYQVNAGSSDELPGEEGLAHFCEHMTFKGTAKRTAWNIINRLESVGGDINAYTKKEDTCFNAFVPAGYTARAVDLLTDVVFCSVYPQKEIDKEVEVICDEIASYRDSPAELIYDDFENILFKGHPLGHNILGTEERVRSFTTADALRFTRKYYRPANAVFYIYGGPDIKTLQRLLLKAFDKYGKDFPEAQPIVSAAHAPQARLAAPAGRTIVMDKHTHQAHVQMGTTAYNEVEYRGRVGAAMDLLNNMVGGAAMNSRLNIVLREHRGLVYTVESSWVVYGDSGQWSVYFGCDEKDVNRCLKLVHRELDKFREMPLTERRLAAAKRQLKGLIGVDSDNHEGFASDFGCIFLHENRTHDIQETLRRIDAVTTADIQQVACDIFEPSRLTTLIYK